MKNSRLSRNNAGSNKHNLVDYNNACTTFKWESVEKELGWKEGSPVNIAHSCIDRHVEEGRGDRIALICHCESGKKMYTYADMRSLTNRFANALKTSGIKKGERVVLLLPASAEFFISFLGVVKTGAIAVPIHSKYMSDALKVFLQDCEPSLVITTSPLCQRISKIAVPSIRRIIVVDGRDNENEWHRLVETSDDCPATEWMSREDPMLLLYTSGSTGNPKGVVHVHEGALQYYQTGRWVLDLKKTDIYWCTADPGWITGISYGVWAPLLNGVTTMVYGGPFDARSWYRLIEDNRITVWYTTPTYLKMLMSAGSNIAREYRLASLRKILSVGEPLNPIINRWSLSAFNLPIYDSWWMTETGALMIANFSCLPLKPGSMGKPIPGIYAAVIDDQGKELPPLEMGQLAIKAGWPAMMRDIWRDREKYNEYFRLPPWYLTGDLAYKDRDGYFWFQGRIDDVIKCQSERVGPFEIESKLVEHPAVTEAGVIGKPDPLRGEIIKAFIVLEKGYTWSNELKQDIRDFIKTRLAPHLVPEEVQVCSSLPRTKSGKLMRRVLKSWELGLPVHDVTAAE
ncbi:MAG: acetate--CoA ligase [Peptococcaceae bacterium]|nr:acetate--CoA ligase [Peptococcaceae bacterium]